MFTLAFESLLQIRDLILKAAYNELYPHFLV